MFKDKDIENFINKFTKEYSYLSYTLLFIFSIVVGILCGCFLTEIAIH